MNRKYVTIIVLVVFAIVSTSLVVDILGSKLSDDATNVSSIENPNALAITRVQGNAGSSSFLVSVYNNSSADIAITVAYVNGCPINIGKEIPLPANSYVNIALNLTNALVFRSTYQITILSSEGFSSTFYKMIL